MIGKYASFRDGNKWLYGEVLDFQFSQQRDTWLFFLAIYSEVGTRLAIVPWKQIRYEDMRGKE